MTAWVLHYDMRAPGFGTPAPRLYEAALDLAAWADERGLLSVVVSEHHGEDDGYLPSPLTMAAALAARTRNAIVSVNALVLTLRDPLLTAEEALVVQHVAGGRLALTVVPGYVPSEFALLGVDYKGRGALLDRKLDAFLRALTGDPFEHEGRTVAVSPGPVGGARPMVLVGGASPAAARRAARFADGFSPTTADERLVGLYRAACAEQGREPGLVAWPPPYLSVFVAEDPEAYWEVLAPHALHELATYRSYAGHHGGPHPYAALTDVRAARDAGVYRVLTPDECIALARQDPEAPLLFKPLIGGLDPEHAWSSLELFASKVLPALA